MNSYALSREADHDLQNIANESVKRWGLARAEAYILGLHQAFQRLVEFPDMGRDASDIRQGYLRMAIASHAVLYRKTETGIFIVRILHQSMDFNRHLQ